MKFIYKLETIDYEFYNKNYAHTILFLHGWGGDKNSFNGLKNLLKSNYNILSLTLPTMQPTLMVWTMMDYYQVIKNILKLHNIEKVIIICHSFGFRVACLLNGIINIEKLVVTGGAGLKKVNILKRIEIQNNTILLKQKKYSYLYEKLASEDYKNLSKINKQTFKNVVNTINNKMTIFNCPILLFWGKSDKSTPVWMAKKIFKDNAKFKKKKINKIKSKGKSKSDVICSYEINDKTEKENFARLIFTNSNHFAYIKLGAVFNNEVIKFLKG